jgi:endonuclease/exonuclease/phosphatase family metal-dependent hydrolase
MRATLPCDAVRVLTFNVRGANAVPTEIGAFVRSIGVDVACLNEVRRGTARAIARAAGMNVVESAGRWRVRYRNAILTQTKPAWSRRFSLSRTGGFPSRTCVVAGVGGIAVGATHLGLDFGERARHARELLDALAQHRRVLLCGDFNERPSGTVLRILSERFEDSCSSASATYPSAAPTARIDYILVTPPTLVISCEVIPTELSDHLAVLAEIDAGPYASAS